MKFLQAAIPASTSNIGPGFDTLGIALSLCNELRVEAAGRHVEVEFAKGVEEKFQSRIRRMVKRAVRAFEADSGRKVGGIRLVFNNNIPIARGLGSSATFRMGTIEALNEWSGRPLNKDSLLDIGCRLERHTENCVASSIGGLVASGFINGRVRYFRFDIGGDLNFIAAVPQRPMSTVEARKILPRRVRFTDAVFNLNRIALLLGAFTAGEFDKLGELLDDKLHQPYRAKIMYPIFDVIGAAREAGAHGAFLSGSGSTIMAITSRKPKSVANAMKEALGKRGWPAEVHVLKADRHGIHLLTEGS